jgi:hypothetical protein
MGFFERRRQEKEFGRNIERQLLDRLALTRELESRGFLTRVDNTWLLVDTGWKVSSSDGMAPASEALVAFTRITNFMTPMVRAIRTASDSSPASPWLTSPASVGLPPTRALGAVKSVEQGREPPLEARLAETQDKIALRLVESLTVQGRRGVWAMHPPSRTDDARRRERSLLVRGRAIQHA